jgi:A/G-specific adenine glycosylase
LKGTLTDQVTQISDAVPPPLAAAVAATLRSAIYDPIERIQNQLLRWWEQNQRDFPWRKTKDPYKVLIAEKLLQQTAARQEVVNAYKHIVHEYPKVESLAEATAEELVPVVQPLGFTYRARELPKLARILRDKHESKIPDDLDSLKDLPGVGDYSARAVLSFAYGHDVPVVDTNVARFLYRLYGIHDEMSANPARNQRLISLAESLIPEGRSRDFNLAILDLCATVCFARNPNCTACPLIDCCDYGIDYAQEQHATA